MNLGSPCGKCPAKGCGAYHSECKLYLDWVANRKQEQERLYKQKTEDSNYIDYMANIVRKTKKRFNIQ